MVPVAGDLRHAEHRCDARVRAGELRGPLVARPLGERGGQRLTNLVLAIIVVLMRGEVLTVQRATQVREEGRLDRTDGIRPLELHFRLKDAFELPDGIVTANEIEFREPVRMGDVVSTRQTVREISDVKTNRLGTGRSWIIDVTYTNQRGEIVGIESYEMFSYVRAAA